MNTPRRSSPPLRSPEQRRRDPKDMSHTDVERPDSSHDGSDTTQVSASEALLVEPSRLSPTRRALTTVLR